VDPLRPYNSRNLVVGAWRALLAPAASTPVPTDLSDVVSLSYPYTPQAPWFDVGAAKSSSTYTRGIDSEGIEIQQETGTIFDEITDTNRGFQLSIAEWTPELLQIVENSPDPEDVGAFDRVPLTSIVDLEQYRLCAINIRKKQSGIVVEGGGRERGRLLAVVLNIVTLSSDDVDAEGEKGSLGEMKVGFTAYPDPNVDAAEGDWGAWYFEEAGPVGSGGSS
jgi:hypothetical protein